MLLQSDWYLRKDDFTKIWTDDTDEIKFVQIEMFWTVYEMKPTWLIIQAWGILGEVNWNLPNLSDACNFALNITHIVYILNSCSKLSFQKSLEDIV